LLADLNARYGGAYDPKIIAMFLVESQKPIMPKKKIETLALLQIILETVIDMEEQVQKSPGQTTIVEEARERFPEAEIVPRRDTIEETIAGIVGKIGEIEAIAKVQWTAESATIIQNDRQNNAQRSDRSFPDENRSKENKRRCQDIFFDILCPISQPNQVYLSMINFDFLGVYEFVYMTSQTHLYIYVHIYVYIYDEKNIYIYL
jgi:hypothetical protein